MKVTELLTLSHRKRGRGEKSFHFFIQKYIKITRSAATIGVQNVRIPQHLRRCPTKIKHQSKRQQNLSKKEFEYLSLAYFHPPHKLTIYG